MTMYLKFILFFSIVNAAIISARNSVVETTCPRDKFSRTKDSLIMGDKTLQSLVRPEKISVSRESGEIQKEIFLQKFDNDKKIKLIMANEDESLGGCVSVVEDGIGTNRVKLEFQSSPGRALHYSVWIYAD